ncbi:MAG: GNAT family N-acetyltransferase [Planctomycetota bacterium]
MRYQKIQNPDKHHHIRTQWDELWRWSSASNPNSRFDNLISACQRFYGGKVELHCVYEGECLVAAIPLVEDTFRQLSVATLPNNEWGYWGDLLVHPQFRTSDAFDFLAGNLIRNTKGILELRYINAVEFRWQQLIHAIEKLGTVIRSGKFEVGMINHAADVEQFYSGLSKSFRKKLRKYHRELSKLGNVEFEYLSKPGKEKLKNVMAEIFELEQAGWKGRENSSINDQQMDEFFCEQASLLAEAGHLAIGTLRLDGRLVAFEFGNLSKKIYSSWKIGYDESLSRLAPGHIIADYMVREFHSAGNCVQQDTIGPVSTATSKWTSTSLVRSRCFAAGSSLRARLLVSAMRVAGRAKRMLGRIGSSR